MAKQSIAEQNDAFRRGEPHIPGHRVMTQGISAFPQEALETIINLILNFDDFTEENDPHGEHDFGSVEYQGTNIFWKIDYYDPTLTKGSEDSQDLTKTARVLTIMLASEY